ncbi:SBP domain containing protein [Zea mays]|uniref:SBP domain containing protein n=1 Tax=Zea mays TaxID=4577 RepID=A0A1D6ICF5_MAIZE|nr:SBP domain containing protein [Zea mays]
MLSLFCHAGRTHLASSPIHSPICVSSVVCARSRRLPLSCSVA